MTLRWEDEKFVKVYTRDTGDWLALGWDAQCLLLASFRKCDRAGLLPTGKNRARGLSAITGAPIEVVERALPLLLADGCMVETDTGLVIRNFVEAQETPASDAKRASNYRARVRDNALKTQSKPKPSRTVTNRHEPSRDVTGRNEPSQTVTTRLDETRRDETRVDETREIPPNPPEGGGQLELVPPERNDAPDAESIRSVFDRYRVYHERAFPLPSSSSKEWKLIRDRLREGHTVETLCDAIDGYHESPFHSGINDTGTKYQGLDLIMRDGSHVANGLRYHEERGKPAMSEKERRGAAAAESWAEKVKTLQPGSDGAAK